MATTKIHMTDKTGERTVISYTHSGDLTKGKVEIAGMGAAQAVFALSEPHGFNLPDQGGPFGYDDTPHQEVYSWVMAVCSLVMIGEKYGFVSLALEDEPDESLWPKPETTKEEMVY